MRLNRVHGVEHDHAFGHGNFIVHRLAAFAVAPEHSHGYVCHQEPPTFPIRSSARICFNSPGISPRGTSDSVIAPPFFTTTMILLAPRVFRLREIEAAVRAAAFRARQRRVRTRLGNRQHALQVARQDASPD